MAKGKKGKKSKKKKKDKKPKVQDAEEEDEYKNFNPLLIAELEGLIPHLEERLEIIQVKRNYMQLERDQVATFYDITKKEVQELDLEIKAKDRDMEVMEDNHNVEVRVYIQKVRHLEYEHKNNVKQVDEEGDNSRFGETADHKKRTKGLVKNKTHYKEKTKEQQEINAAEIKALNERHSRALDKLREQFEGNLVKKNNSFQDKLVQLRKDLELRRKVEIHEIEERKNLHINDLMQSHQKAFKQIKNYYNAITKDNLNLIKELKNEVASMKAKTETTKKKMVTISHENRRLTDPLKLAVKEVQALEAALKDREKDTLALTNAKARAHMLEKELIQAEAEYVELKNKFQRLEQERDELLGSFTETVRTVQRQSELHNLVMQKKLSVAASELDNHNEKLNQVVEAAQLDPVALQSMTQKLDGVLFLRNQSIEKLIYQINRVAKAHDDSCRTLEQKLKQFGIPHEDNFLDKSVFIGSATTGPAGLVTAS